MLASLSWSGGYDARRCGGLLVLMPLLVCWLFADSSQCKGMQTAGRQVVHAPCVSGGGASVWPKTGRAARGVASSVVCQSCSDIAVEGGKRETTVRWRGLLA